jgi:hypothetical protein
MRVFRAIDNDAKSRMISNHARYAIMRLCDQCNANAIMHAIDESRILRFIHAIDEFIEKRICIIIIIANDCEFIIELRIDEIDDQFIDRIEFAIARMRIHDFDCIIAMRENRHECIDECDHAHIDLRVKIIDINRRHHHAFIISCMIA